MMRGQACGRATTSAAQLAAGNGGGDQKQQRMVEAMQEEGQSRSGTTGEEGWCAVESCKGNKDQQGVASTAVDGSAQRGRATTMAAQLAVKSGGREQRQQQMVEATREHPEQQQAQRDNQWDAARAQLLWTKNEVSAVCCDHIKVSHFAVFKN